MPNKQFQVKDKPLKQKVLEYISDHEPVTIQQIMFAFPDQSRANLYRAIRKNNTPEVQIVKDTSQTPHTFSTAEYAGQLATHSFNISGKLREVLDEHDSIILGLLSPDLEEDSRLFGMTIYQAYAHAMLSHNQHHREQAQRLLSRVERALKLNLKITQLLQIGVRTGFTIPPKIGEQLPTLKEKVDEEGYY